MPLANASGINNDHALNPMNEPLMHYVNHYFLERNPVGGLGIPLSLITGQAHSVLFKSIKASKLERNFSLKLNRFAHVYSFYFIPKIKNYFSMVTLFI